MVDFRVIFTAFLLCMGVAVRVNGQRHYCGATLDLTMTYICPNGTNRHNLKAKRANANLVGEFETIERDADVRESGDGDADAWWLVKAYAETAPFLQIRRMRAGEFRIIEECCKKMCRTSELRKYCRE